MTKRDIRPLAKALGVLLILLLAMAVIVKSRNAGRTKSVDGLVFHYDPGGGMLSIELDLSDPDARIGFPVYPPVYWMVEGKEYALTGEPRSDGAEKKEATWSLSDVMPFQRGVSIQIPVANVKGGILHIDVPDRYERGLAKAMRQESMPLFVGDVFL